ncbi:hypothetical protein HPB52_000717 [Rhipicephalus sanguineus]|uniref:Uncharacterized protein n=1 Tax=Rhipicephalus sanguineus TaxID=34632 RepID=A0A9D4T8B3_RHISA|nr:hypothetical protein HPB52_000717 [Rhipicephalus sanguineus]
MPVALRVTLQGVSFADYVEVDTFASVCGALTDEDIIARVAGAQPVAEEREGEENEDDKVPVRPSASQVMEALNVTRLFFSFEEGEEDSLRRVRALEQRATAVPFREKKQMVPLGKAVFFASGAWRDMKSETILHCFEKAGFLRGSSAAKEITAEPDIDASAADGAAAVMSLGQLWEAAGNASLVPSGLDHLHFALADQNLVATEELTTNELAASVSVKGTSADSSSSDGEGDDIGAPQPGTAGAALAAVDTLRMYLCSKLGSCDLMDNVQHRVPKRAREMRARDP